MPKLLAEQFLEVVLEVWRWRSALDGCGGRASKRSTYGVVLIHEASSCFYLKHGGGALGIAKSPVCNYNEITTINHGPLSASHNFMYFSFLSERGGRRKRLVHDTYISTNIISAAAVSYPGIICIHETQRQQEKSPQQY